MSLEVCDIVPPMIFYHLFLIFVHFKVYINSCLVCKSFVGTVPLGLIDCLISPLASQVNLEKLRWVFYSGAYKVNLPTLLFFCSTVFFCILRQAEWRL